MSAKPGSRWASTKEDAELEAKIKREKEEKRRRKAEKARKLEEEKQASAAAAAAAAQQDRDDDDDDGRPSKRRKLTPDPKAPGDDDSDNAPGKLLRFEAGTWGKSRSVENYDKLNDIEEGTYGWVARATQLATGRVVALKRLKLDFGDRGGLPVTGLREIQILRDCKHRNVVDLEEVVVGDDVTRLDK